jgi:DNA-binding NarL/FixJ family response regulator
MRILVVCNHMLIGRSLVAMLQHHPRSMSWDVALCGDSEAVEKAQKLSADVLLVDVTNDFTNSMLTIRAIANALPDRSIVALGPTADERSAFATVVAGSDGYLAWDDGEDALVDTLQSALRGELGLSGRVARTVVRQLRQMAHWSAAQAEFNAALTAREQEIFDLVRRGVRSREIAEALCIADATVYKHIQHILEKLHVRSRTQAIMLTELDPSYPIPHL